uniref:Uncharacterized protein n=1 Tax=Cucumis melo TaxID=3656 RepID=A0A9I9EAA4_CUCME
MNPRVPAISLVQPCVCSVRRIVRANSKSPNFDSNFESNIMFEDFTSLRSFFTPIVEIIQSFSHSGDYIQPNFPIGIPTVAAAIEDRFIQAAVGHELINE